MLGCSPYRYAHLGTYRHGRAGSRTWWENSQVDQANMLKQTDRLNLTNMMSASGFLRWGNWVETTSTHGCGSLTGTGPEKTKFPENLFFALHWNLGFFWFLVPDWSLKSKIRALQRIVYTSRFLSGNPNPCNDHIYHSYASESRNLIFYFERGVSGGGGVQGVIIVHAFI
jgi:hypothetical protein